MQQLLDSLRDLVAALDRTGRDYAIGGAIALGAWAAPRATKDIDVTLWCTEDEVREALVELVEAGAAGDVDALVRQSAERGLAVMSWRGIRLDVFTPSIDFYEEALRRRVLRDLPFIGKVWILSAEVLAVFKLLFNRPKDWVDIASLVGVQGSALDKSWVRAQLVSMVGEEDERIARWDSTSEAGS